MLSLHSSYPKTDRCFGNSFAEEGSITSDLHVRPRKEPNRTRFSTDELHVKSDRAPDVASMAAIFLSTSPDLASSLIHEYFRSESFDEVRRNLSSQKAASQLKTAKVSAEQNEIIESPDETTHAENHRESENAKAQNVESISRVPKQRSLLRSKSEISPTKSLKKTVKFADDDGLPLAVVKEFKRFDYFESLREELFQSSLPDPKIMSTYGAESSSAAIVAAKPPSPPRSKKQAPAPGKYVSDFPIPSHNFVSFMCKVKKDLVCLENVFVSDNRVAGVVRVLNYCFQKKVFVRYTTDHWRTSKEVECKYVNNGLDRSMSDTDSFAFDLTGPTMPIQPDHEIQFCVRFEAGSDHHWDNNDGKNYSIITAEFVRLRNKVREEEERSGFRFGL